MSKGGKGEILQSGIMPDNNTEKPQLGWKREDDYSRGQPVC